MGAVVVLHPHDSLNNHHDNLFPKPMMKSHQITHLNHPKSHHRRQTQPRRVVRKNIGNTEVVVVAEQPATTEFFAGFAFVDSPPPSSVPLPVLFMKGATRNDPTADLRRILGLSLS